MAVSLNLTTNHKKVFNEVIKAEKIKINYNTEQPQIEKNNFETIVDAIAKHYFTEDKTNPGSSRCEILRSLAARLDSYWKFFDVTVAEEEIEEAEVTDTTAETEEEIIQHSIKNKLTPPKGDRNV